MSSGDGWSTPSLYNQGQLFEPRTFAEADPLEAFFIPEWDDGDEQGWAPHSRPAPAWGEPQWGTTTYVGPHRLRPGDGGVGDTQVPGAESTAVDTTSAGPPGRHAANGRATQQDRAAAQAEPRGSLMSNSRTMAIASLVSRITGFARTILLLAALGTGAVANAYNGANTFPNMVYELLLGGVLTSVLVPLLVRAQVEDDDDGVAYTQRLLSIATALLTVMTIAAVAAAPWIAGAFAPASQYHLTVVFASLLLPEILFYGLGAMLMAVLNIRHSYAPGMWAPVLNNMVVIATVIVFFCIPGPKDLTPDSITTTQILVIGIGTTLGIVAQALVLVPFLRQTGFRWQWRFKARPNEVGRLQEVGRLGAWVLGYVVASQIGVSVIQRIGQHNDGLTIFSNADLLFQMPYGILVVSLLTAIMPRMSRAAVRGDEAEVVSDFGLAARLSVVAMVPITAGLIVLGPDLGVLLFGYKRTTPDQARLIGESLAWSAFGLVFFAILMLQMRVFYAMRDGRTPTLINVVMVAVKISLIFATNGEFWNSSGHASNHAIVWLNVSTSVSYVVGVLIGHVVLTKRLGHLGFRIVVKTAVRIAVVSAIGGLAAYGVVLACRDVFGNGHLGATVGAVVGALVGLAVMAVAARALRVREFREVAAMARRS